MPASSTLMSSLQVPALIGSSRAKRSVRPDECAKADDNRQVREPAPARSYAGRKVCLWDA